MRTHHYTLLSHDSKSSANVAPRFSVEKKRRRRIGGGSERHYMEGGIRNSISGFEDSQAVPACPACIGRAYDWIFLFVFIYFSFLCCREMSLQHLGGIAEEPPPPTLPVFVAYVTCVSVCISHYCCQATGNGREQHIHTVKNTSIYARTGELLYTSFSTVLSK
jgi:hypothetical protein